MGIKIGDSMVETQTIDVEHVQKILKNCPNYDIIVNSEFPFEDTFSDKLVDWYRELVFSANGNNEGQLKIINALDKSIYLYVTNNRYKRGLRKIVDENNYNCLIEVDGGINDKTYSKVINAGADVLVSGSFLFKSANMKESIKLLKGK